MINWSQSDILIKLRPTSASDTGHWRKLKTLLRAKLILAIPWSPFGWAVTRKEKWVLSYFFLQLSPLCFFDVTLVWCTSGLIEFSHIIRQRDLKTQQSLLFIRICLRKTRSGRSIGMTKSFSKSSVRFQIVFKFKFVFPRFEERFRNSKAPFSWRLVWMVGLTAKIIISCVLRILPCCYENQFYRYEI